MADEIYRITFGARDKDPGVDLYLTLNEEEGTYSFSRVSGNPLDSDALLLPGKTLRGIADLMDPRPGGFGLEKASASMQGIVEEAQKGTEFTVGGA